MSAPPVEAGRSDDSALSHALGLLTRSGGRRGVWARRAATVHLGYLIGRQVWQEATKRRNGAAYTVSVHDTDAIYGEVQRWVLERMPPAHQRALIAQTARRDRVEIGVAGRKIPEISLHFDGNRAQRVTVGGHPVDVSITRDESQVQQQMGYSDARGSRSWWPAKITFTTRNLEARDAVVAFLDGVAGDYRRRERPPYLRTATFWGDWQAGGALQPRPLDTVVLADGVLEGLIADLERFLAARAAYRRRGIPWHRGYLLSGPPGTGKTSAALALACRFDLDVWVMPLSDLREDAVLGRMLGSIEPPAMLLLEDVDVASAATSRDDTHKGVSLSGLLNALDGVATPDGLITVLTTNHPGRLDEALVRPGRVDVHEQLGAMDADQVCRLLDAFELPRPGGAAGAALEAGEVREGLTPAEIVGVAKRHLDGAEPADLAADLERVLTEAPDPPPVAFGIRTEEGTMTLADFAEHGAHVAGDGTVHAGPPTVLRYEGAPA